MMKLGYQGDWVIHDENQLCHVTIESMLHKQYTVISKMPRIVPVLRNLELPYPFLKKDLSQQLLGSNAWNIFCIVSLEHQSLIRRFHFKTEFNNPTPICCYMSLPQYCGPNLASTSSGIGNQAWISGMCCNQQTRLNQIIFHFCFQKTQRQQCTLPANDLQICCLKNEGVFKFYECENPEIV